MSKAEPVTDADQLPARLAELVLSVSRRLSLLDHADVGSVPLSPLEAMVMRHIDAEPGTTPSRIAARLGLRSSNTSAALRDLEAKGFIRREVDPDDGRSVRVEPTAFARENLASKRRYWVQLLAPMLDDAAGLAAATSLLAALDHDLEAAAGVPSNPKEGR
ncbi:MAG: MarR family transcriptional regulator [Propionicimonas sp.]|uniref:MarR family winged helix-turn-helix transcriptional regulator n=1 Tax=Propionicimonas sp. TaxID=1955623 RepID=UPI003D09DA09